MVIINNVVILLWLTQEIFITLQLKLLKVYDEQQETARVIMERREQRRVQKLQKRKEKEEKSAAIAQRRNEEFETFKPIEFEMTYQQTKNKILFEFVNPIKSSYNNCSSWYR